MGLNTMDFSVETADGFLKKKHLNFHLYLLKTLIYVNKYLMKI